MNYQSYDELPLMLSVKDLAQVMGISKSGAYNLARSYGFPRIIVGSRILIPKDKFLNWLEESVCKK